MGGPLESPRWTARNYRHMFPQVGKHFTPKQILRCVGGLRPKCFDRVFDLVTLSRWAVYIRSRSHLRVRLRSNGVGSLEFRGRDYFREGHQDHGSY